MKIIIEVEGAHGQPEIRRETSQAAEQQTVVNAPVGISTSAIDAGEPRIQDGSRSDSSTVEGVHGSSFFSSSGAIDAGGAKVQDIIAVASAMPDTGNMETFNTANAFSAGGVANPVSN